MPRKRRPAPISATETAEWLYKCVNNAPRPLPPGRFPLLIQQAESLGHNREHILNTLDEWLNYGYCRLIDPISQDIEITMQGEGYFY